MPTSPNGFEPWTRQSVPLLFLPPYSPDLNPIELGCVPLLVKRVVGL